MDRLTAGAIEVVCLVDGAHEFEPEDFPELNPEETSRRLTRAGLTTVGTHFNFYLLRHAGGLDLVDTGCGTQFGPGAGRMLDLLAGLGVTPAQIDRVILTHLHTDHSGGLMQGDRPLFPKAQVLLHRAELDYWRDRDAFRRKVVEAYAARLITFGDDQDIGQGLRVWALPGHTPGHVGLRVGDDLVLTGDTLHSEALQLSDINTLNANDTDRAGAGASRLRALTEIADRGMIWSGSHMFEGPKFARLARDGAGFRRVAL